MDVITKAGAQSGDAPFTFVLSDESVDRMGDVVVQSGISLVEFRKNPVALFAHQAKSPIGTWTNIRRENNQLIADLKLAARGTSRVIDELRSLIEQKILRAASIGFGVIKSEPLDPEKPYGGQRYTKTELMEASLVAVPANPNALTLARSLSAEARALFFVDEAQGNPSNAPATSAARAATPRVAVTKGVAMDNKGKSIAEKIKAFRTRLDGIDGEAEAVRVAAEAGDVMTEAQTAQVAALTEERGVIEKNLASLESLEKLIGERAEPATHAASGPAFVRTRGSDKEPPGTLITRSALVHIMAHMRRKDVQEVARELYPNDSRMDAITKAAVGIADTTTAGWAKELVAQDVQGFVEAMVPLSAYAALASRGLVLDFGTYGTISIPYRAGTNQDVAGAFVGENGVIPVKRTTLGANVMARYKMGVITTITKELSRSSTPQAETLLRRFMADDTAVTLDKTFLDNIAAVPGVRPAGILNGVNPLSAQSGAGSAVDKAIIDLKAMVNALIAAGNGVRPVFLMNTAQKLSLGLMYSGGIFLFRDELAQGRLLGVEVVASNNIAPADIILVDAAHFATGLGTPEYDVSDTATLVMADAGAAAPTNATLAADPTAIGTPEQVPPDGGLKVSSAAQAAAGKAGEGASAVSMFQQWTIALRTVLPVSWGMMRAGSVQHMPNVTW